MASGEPSAAASSGAPAEALAFLAAHSQAFLFTILADGSPMGWPMVGRLHDGAMEFSTYRKSAKVRALLQRARASCLVVPREGERDRRTLMVSGAVSIRDGHDGVDAGPADIGTGGAGIAVPDEVIDTVKARHRSSTRCVVRIELQDLRFGALPAVGWRGP